MITGVNAPGTAMLARMAVARLPLVSTTRAPALMSVAVARYGMFNWLKSAIPAALTVMDCMTLLNFWPEASPCGKIRPLPLSPSSISIR